MIKIPNIPIEPQKEDFDASDYSVSVVGEKRKENKRKHQRYENKNVTVSYFLGYVVCCIITGLIVISVNPKISTGGIIFCSLVFGAFLMLFGGFIITGIFNKVGETLEPSRIPRKDYLKRANDYLIEKEEYDNKLKVLSIKYPELHNADYNEIKYNELCKTRIYEKVEEMLRLVRIRSMKCTSLHMGRIFNNLELIGISSKELINSYHHIYKCLTTNGYVALTYMDNISEHYLKVFCEIKNDNGLDKGIIVTGKTDIKDEIVKNLIQENSIEIISHATFERAALKELEKPELSFLDPSEIPFENTKRITARFEGGNTIIFALRIVDEVFSTRKEILERIKKSEPLKGWYGLIPIFPKKDKPFYGLVYFQWEYEFDYYREWFTHAIQAWRQEISEIETNYSTWDPHKRFKYRWWSNYAWD